MCEPHHVSAQRHIPQSLSDAGQGSGHTYQAATNSHIKWKFDAQAKSKGLYPGSRPPGKDRRIHGALGKRPTRPQSPNI